MTGSQCKASITSSPPDRGLPDNHARQEDTVFVTNNKKSERPVDALAVKTLITHSLTDNFKSRDASASKNCHVQHEN